MHTLPLSHAPRRESGAPHRFPGPAHRAAPHPRAGVLKNTCFLTSGIFEATPGTGRLMAGSPGLGSGTATAHTRLSARGGPRSPPYAALPQFSCMGKTVFFRPRIKIPRPPWFRLTQNPMNSHCQSRVRVSMTILDHTPKVENNFSVVTDRMEKISDC